MVGSHGRLAEILTEKSLQMEPLFSRVLRHSIPRFVHPIILLSVVHILCNHVFFLLLYCSCPIILVNTNTAPAHPQVTGVPVYLTFLVL